jgi:3-oxoadipate enol-lactonase/4-carboxymuconolactone decarboxylase
MPKTTANGIELYYDLAGPENAPVVAFSNSLSGTVEIWDGVVPILADSYRCLRYDTRAHGRSASADEPITIDDLAADLAGLLDGLGIARAHVVGLSLGGMTAQALASAHPERVASLALMATSPYLPPAEFWRDRAAQVRAEGVAAVVDAVVGRWFTPPFYKASPATVERVRERFVAVDAAGYARCCEAIATMNLRPRLGRITAPTLVVVGNDDQVTPPAMAEELRTGIAAAEMVILPNLAHLMSIERPDVVGAYLRAFLDRQNATRQPAASTFDRGFEVRKAVLGTAHVEASLAQAGAFGAPWQDFITRIAWGEIWGDPTLPRKTRSLVTLATMIALHREEEFKLHVRPALVNGVSPEELRALVMHSAMYAGVPAGNAAFRWLREVLGEEMT